MNEVVTYERAYAVITKYPPRMPSRWKPALNMLVNGSIENKVFAQAMVLHGDTPVRIIVPGYSVPLAVNKNIPWRKIQLDIDVVKIDVTFTKIMGVTRYKSVVLDFHSDHLHLARSLGYAVEDLPIDEYQRRLNELLAEDAKKIPTRNLLSKTYGEWMQGKTEA